MRPSWAIAALGLALAACGTAEPDRFSLRTPGVEPGGQPAAPIPAPSAPRAPSTERVPVTAAERRIIKGWADALRNGRVQAASRYFAVPSLISNNTPGFVVLDSDAAVQEFNRTLPCGARLVRTRRATDNFVVGIFRLTERKGGTGCGTGTGELAAVAFLIRADHITRWVRVDPGEPDGSPGPAPTPAAEPPEFS